MMYLGAFGVECTDHGLVFMHEAGRGVYIILP